MPEIERNQKTMMIFSSDLDKVMAAFNIAIGALSMGFQVNMFFTFWGINVLKKENMSLKNKSLMEKMFGLMMPKGVTKLKLSQMHMLGMGTWMMKKRMVAKKIALLPELLELSQSMGVKFIACEMTMDMMGIKQEDLIDGCEIAGAAGYLEEAEKSNYNLFI